MISWQIFEKFAKFKHNTFLLLRHNLLLSIFSLSNDKMSEVLGAKFEHILIGLVQKKIIILYLLLIDIGDIDLNIYIF